MKKLILFGSVILSLSLVACSNSKKTNETNNVEQQAASVVDYSGVYKGVLPCADCPGIETSLELKDGKYVLTSVYQEKGVDPIVESGSFSVDQAKGIITLDGIQGGPNKYLASNTSLKQLDMDGNEITGALAALYILNKQ